MKNVFSTSELCHVFANELQETGRAAASMFISGKTIYSYGHHFPIAKHVEVKGNKALLFTLRTYSSTTTSHVSAVRMAVSHKNIIYCFNPDSGHDVNFNYWAEQIEQHAKKLISARKPELYTTAIEREINQATIYANYFGVKFTGKLKAAANIKTSEDYKNFAKNAAKEVQKLEAAKKRKAIKSHNEALKNWLEFKTDRMYTRALNCDYLRLNPQNNRFETSQGVVIPFELAKKLFTSIENNTLEVGAKVLEFEVSEVGAKIKIGCHSFDRKYILTFKPLFN